MKKLITKNNCNICNSSSAFRYLDKNIFKSISSDGNNIFPNRDIYKCNNFYEVHCEDIKDGTKYIFKTLNISLFATNVLPILTLDAKSVYISVVAAPG